MRRGVLGLVGRTIDRVEKTKCRCKPIVVQPRIDAMRRRLVGHRLASVRRLGKRLLFDTADPQTLVVEPRMTGLVLLADPPDAEHLRLRVGFAGRPRAELLFWDRRGLGTVRLLTREQAAALEGTALGPDALTVTVDQLRTKLGSSRRAIKVGLMDQQAVAGIGNLYASEILHVAAVHPATPCQQLSRRRWTRIHAAIGAVLQEAIRYEGSTLSDGTYRNALNQSGRYQNCHRVYDRAGKTCPTCDRAAIQRIVQAQRSTFYCPRCQSARRRSAKQSSSPIPSPSQREG
jgi:formamidopyrimidine-DNA glycosylase